MKGNREQTNILLLNRSPFDPSCSLSYCSPMKQSQYLDTSKNLKQQPSAYDFPENFKCSFDNPYWNKNISTKQSSQKNSMMRESQISGKESLFLERSKSQVIQPIYFSANKNELKQQLNQSKELGSSKISQITFSKSSEFIINAKKQNFPSGYQKKSFMSASRNYANDYECPSNNFYQKVYNLKQSSLQLCSPMKYSSFIQYSNPAKSNAIINLKPQFYPVVGKQAQYLFNEKKIIRTHLQLGHQIIKHRPNAFCIKPSVRRCLSNISILSQNSSKSSSSVTKIKFHYISPPKSQKKTVRKLSFKKGDIQNPLSKLAKKKQQEKTKIINNSRQKVNSEVVNEYFPEFKIKKNKMKRIQSPKNLKETLYYKTYQCQPSQASQNSDRKLTFISGLDGLSQISEIKHKQKQDSTQISHEAPKNVPKFGTQHQNIESQSKNQSNSITFNKTGGFRIKFEDQKNYLACSGKQEEPSNKSQVFKDSQISVTSIKNGDSRQFVQITCNDSSHTTDYEQEIVRKIKKDLGLNYSYHKK